MDNIRLLKDLYREREGQIKKRLEEFELVWHFGDEEDLFTELAFCIFTPQSKAKTCDRAVKALREKGLLLSGTFTEVRGELKGVRFPNNKTRYLLHARERLEKDGNIRIKEFLHPGKIFASREWLVDNIKGLGYKEASHFLRNIGLGKSLAILDVHIMRNMHQMGLIDEKISATSKKIYFDLEKKLKDFCLKTGIPLAHMDLLLWSKETGEIFK